MKRIYAVITIIFSLFIISCVNNKENENSELVLNIKWPVSQAESLTDKRIIPETSEKIKIELHHEIEKDNFLNVYTWQSTTYKKNVYFGTLDIRASLWSAIVGLIGEQLQNPQIIQELLNLPEFLIILFTEYLLNINFSIEEFFANYFDKLLYFDVLKLDNNQKFSSITLDGFKNANPSLPDEGVRNLDIVNNCNGLFLLTGSTCYQANNTAKVYTYKIGE